MAIKARLTNRAQGPRGVWASGELIDVQPGTPRVLIFASKDEIDDIDTTVFKIETGEDATDPTIPQRLFLALADSDDHAGFRFIDMGAASIIGMAIGEEAPVLPAGYRWNPIINPDGMRGESLGDVDTSAADRDAPDPELVKAAVDGLDHANDDHWTKAGKPSVDAVKDALGADVTRAEIEAAAPDAERVKPA